jgi:hypothetical protein
MAEEMMDKVRAWVVNEGDNGDKLLLEIYDLWANTEYLNVDKEWSEPAEVAVVGSPNGIHMRIMVHLMERFFTAIDENQEVVNNG